MKQYYYKTNDCKALHATDAECICWHDEGTGPFPGHRIGVHTCHWRDKPDANKMVSDTPRMESVAGHARGIVDAGILAEGMKLERELNEANERIEALNRGNANAERILCDAAGVGSGRDVLEWIVAANDRIKRLEEALESIQEYWNRDNNERAMENACWHAWRKAKEAKP